MLWLVIAGLPAHAQSAVSADGILDTGGFNLIGLDHGHQIRIDRDGKIVAAPSLNGVAFQPRQQIFGIKGLEAELKNFTNLETRGVSIILEEGAPDGRVLQLVEMCLRLKIPAISIAKQRKPTEQGAAPKR